MAVPNLAKQAILSLHYLPSIAYLSTVYQVEDCFMEVFENYKKGTFRNRAYIATSNGIQRLSIPLKKGKNEQMPIKEVLIANEERWQINHWRSIRTAYQSAPFFEYYMDDLAPLYEKKVKYLFDWNEIIFSFLLDAFQLDIDPLFTDAYHKEYPPDIFDTRALFKPNQVEDHYIIKPYQQVFQEKHGFIPNLSSLDLLFCTGTEAQSYF